ncbi:MAG: DUF167 domain-containing protein [Tepidisphaeraceae bacterium]
MIARQDGNDVLLNLKVVPGAKRTKIVGPLGDALKVAVSAPPSDGAANAAVIELLAQTLGISGRQIAITSGQTSPRKMVRIHGGVLEHICQLLAL